MTQMEIRRWKEKAQVVKWHYNPWVFKILIFNKRLSRMVSELAEARLHQVWVGLSQVRMDEVMGSLG